MTPEQFKQQLARFDINVKKAIHTDLPRIIGNEAARLFRMNFQKESFFDQKWNEVKRRQPPAAKGAAGKRKILTGKTGDLGRSIKVKTVPGRVTIYSDVPYSLAHNQGARNAGRGNRTTIPQRQFIGDHDQLKQALREKFEQEMNKIFKQ